MLDFLGETAAADRVRAAVAASDDATGPTATIAAAITAAL